MHRYASNINGLRKFKGSLQLRGKPVPSVKCQSALRNFLEYLDDLRSLAAVQTIVLVAHHAVFDMKFLCKEFSKYHLWNEFKPEYQESSIPYLFFENCIQAWKATSWWLLRKFSPVKSWKAPTMPWMTVKF